jgi:tetratricopeptide (TPR) repeat protein
MVLQPPAVGPASATKSGFKIWQGLIGFISVIALIAGCFYLLKPQETPYSKAVALIDSGKAAAAVPILEDLSRQQPDNAMLFPPLAQAYLRTDRLAEGRVALDTALRLNVPNPSLSKTVLAYSNYYQQHGDYEEAESLFESASLACPAKDLADGRATFYIKWAEVEMRSAKLDSAVKHLETALSLAQTLPDATRNSLKHNLSDAYRQQAAVAEMKEQSDEHAQAILEKCLTVSDEPATRMALAAIYTREKKVDEAIQNYQIVARADVNNLEARHHLIDLLCLKKDFQTAQVALTELVDKEKSVDNFQLLATVDLQLGNYAGAVRAYEDALALRLKPDMLKELLAVLNDWSALLSKQHKNQEALAVKGHADRVSDQLSELTRPEKPDDDNDDDKAEKANKKTDVANTPIALSFSRIWLARGSLTPEGEIRIKNVSGQPLTDLSLTAVFYDNTAKRTTGSVVLPIATPQSPPFPADGTRPLYFSCPNIIKADHQLAVILFWKGGLLKEFPVVKL